MLTSAAAAADLEGGEQGREERGQGGTTLREPTPITALAILFSQDATLTTSTAAAAADLEGGEERIEEQRPVHVRHILHLPADTQPGK